MALVRLLTSLANAEQAWAAGDVYECDEGTAVRMIAAGYAVPLTAGPAPIEVAVDVQPVERAIGRGPRKKGAGTR